MKEERENDIMKTGKKLLCLLLLLAVLDVTYRFTVYPKDLREHCTLIALSQKAADEQADIVYLGESSNHTYSEQDHDRRSICGMIQDRLPGHKVGELVKDACHAGIYYDILRNIPRDNNVKTVVVTVNMRSFSSEWRYSDLETALREEQVFMEKAPALYKRFLLAFKGHPHWSEDERQKKIQKGFKQQTLKLPHYFPYRNASEWDQAVSECCCLYNGRKTTLDTVALTCHYIKDFAYQLNNRNPRVKDLDRIVKLCKRRNWTLILHILPDNIDQMGMLAGPELVAIMHSNAQYIVNRYGNQSVVVINNQDLVRDRHFRDRDFPTEHYDQTGRRAVAASILPYLSQEEITKFKK